jgi:hypothetical protein
MFISTSENTDVKLLGRNTSTASSENALILRSIDVPYLVCNLSAFIVE